jgi:hypothetical protein
MGGGESTQGVISNALPEIGERREALNHGRIHSALPLRQERSL